MRFVPNRLTLNRPWRADADKIIMFDFRHIISDDKKQPADAKRRKQAHIDRKAEIVRECYDMQYEKKAINATLKMLYTCENLA